MIFNDLVDNCPVLIPPDYRVLVWSLLAIKLNGKIVLVHDTHELFDVIFLLVRIFTEHDFMLPSTVIHHDLRKFLKDLYYNASSHPAQRFFAIVGANTISRTSDRVTAKKTDPKGPTPVLTTNKRFPSDVLLASKHAWSPIAPKEINTTVSSRSPASVKPMAGSTLKSSLTPIIYTRRKGPWNQ